VGPYAKAIAEIQAQLEKRPSDVRLLLKLADIYQKEGRASDANEIYGRVAGQYVVEGFLLKGIAIYRQVLRHDPSHAAERTKLAALYRSVGMVAEAEEQERHAPARDLRAALLGCVTVEPDDLAVIAVRFQAIAMTVALETRGRFFAAFWGLLDADRADLCVYFAGRPADGWLDISASTLRDLENCWIEDHDLPVVGRAHLKIPIAPARAHRLAL